jgi:hypothetical protein
MLTLFHKTSQARSEPNLLLLLLLLLLFFLFSLRLPASFKLHPLLSS